MTEAQIEKKMVRRIEARGGRSYKFVSPGAAGVPDRVVLAAGGRVVFVELKTETGRLRQIQRWQIGRMRQLGADVRVLGGWEQVEAFVDEIFPKGGGVR